MPAPSKQFYLTAEPILSALDRIGGVSSLPMPARLPIEGVPPKKQLSREDAEDSANVTFCNMRKSGRVELVAADRICIDYFGVHPMEIYGMDWFDVDDPACPILYTHGTITKGIAA
jgi:hypothetical protein